MATTPSKQMAIEAVVHREVAGIEMGVMRDGTAFLSGRGLASLCGVDEKVIRTLAAEYSPTSGRPRDKTVAGILEQQGYAEPKLFMRARIGGQDTSAYPDIVCMAVLEYYAFDAKERKQVAIDRYRVLARKSLRDFIYTQVGYDPGNRIPAGWRQFQDRLLLNSAPVGYFSVFKETADIVVSAIRHGLEVDEHTVPDISIGICWGKYWGENRLDQRHGTRQKYPHKYPDYFPQAQVDTEAWVYPLDALGEFRTWLLNDYLPQNFPRYVLAKVKRNQLPPSMVELVGAVQEDMLGVNALPPQRTP